MTDETIEQDEAQEIIEDVEETTVESTDGPTLEDYERLVKENKTLRAQKEHFKKKATQTTKETLTTNTPSGLTREEAILFAKGMSEEDIELASKIAKVNGVSLTKAIEDDYFQAKFQSKQQEIRSKGAQLGASTGGGFSMPSNLSDGDHEAQARAIMSRL